MAKSKLRKVGAYDVDDASLESAFQTVGVSRTQQHQAADADINTIVKRFKVTGFLPQGKGVPSYGDFDSVVDYRSAMDAVIAAEKSFMALPSSIRTKFDNDPQKFIEFAENAENLPELRKMGLAPPEVVKEPVEVRVIPEAVKP